MPSRRSSNQNGGEVPVREKFEALRQIREHHQKKSLRTRASPLQRTVEGRRGVLLLRIPPQARALLRAQPAVPVFTVAGELHHLTPVVAPCVHIVPLPQQQQQQQQQSTPKFLKVRRADIF